MSKGMFSGKNIKNAIVDPLGVSRGGHDAFGVINPELPDMPAPEALPEPGAQSQGNATTDVATRASDFLSREADVRRAASAAGATRSDNDADLLGSVRPAKKRSASRRLLGG